MFFIFILNALFIYEFLHVFLIFSFHLDTEKNISPHRRNAGDQRSFRSFQYSHLSQARSFMLHESWCTLVSIASTLIAVWTFLLDDMLPICHNFMLWPTLAYRVTPASRDVCSCLARQAKCCCRCIERCLSLLAQLWLGRVHKHHSIPHGKPMDNWEVAATTRSSWYMLHVLAVLSDGTGSSHIFLNRCRYNCRYIHLLLCAGKYWCIMIYIH